MPRWRNRQTHRTQKAQRRSKTNRNSRVCSAIRALTVPAEILVRTDRERRRLQDEGTRFARTLATETVCLVGDGAAL